MEKTTRTIENPFRERHLLAMSTLATGLRGVGRVNSHNGSASFFRFADHLAEKGRPRRISNAFGQTMIMHHAIDAQIFHTDQAIVSNNVMAVLMGEIASKEGDAFVYTSNDLAMFAALSRPLGQFRMPALHFGKGFLFLTKEPGVLNRFSCGKGGKGFESHINAHWLFIGGESLGVAFNGERGIPFASGGPMDRTRFHPSLHWAMIHHFDAANFRKTNPLIMSDAEATLREGEAVIAIGPTKARIAWLVTGLDATKEGFECQIDANRDILKHLGMNLFESRALVLEHVKRLLLLIEREAGAVVLIGGFALFQQIVIEPTALLQRLVELFDLFFVG